MGAATSKELPTVGPKKEGGVTPTIVKGTPFSVEGAAHRVGGPSEAALPERVADDGHRAFPSSAPPVVLEREGAPQDRRHADHVEERAAREEAGDDLGFPALREIEARVGERRRALQELVLPIADLLPDRVRPRAALQAHEADGIAHGQRAQDQAVHERVDRGVGADAEGQGQDRHEGEGRAAAQDADAVREVLAEVLEEARAPRVAALLLHLLDAPELDARAAAGLGLGEAGAHVVGRLALDVVAQLGVELGLEAAAAEEPAEESHQAPPSRVARMRADRLGQPAPLLLLHPEAGAPLPGQAVELRLAARLRLLPLGREQAPVLEPVQRGVERSLLHLDHVPRDLLQPLRDRVAVEGAEGHDLEDQQVERPLGQIGSGFGHASHLVLRHVDVSKR